MDNAAEGGHSRKRHRAEEYATQSFKLAHSSGSSAPRDSHIRAPHNIAANDALLSPTTADTGAHALEPLHPPIPNFSVISQGAPRPASRPQTTPDPSGGIIYNIALPLPNPGRAHRFCQACEHVNHVRRKLCTNCGAPKPSAVRNAVGVRSISAVDLSHSDGHISHQPHDQGILQSNEPELSQRLIAQDFAPADVRPTSSSERIHRTLDHGPYQSQARSLVLRCQGDEMPLLGSGQRVPTAYPGLDPHSSSRLRGGQPVLNDPLVAFSAQLQDQKNVPRQNGPYYGNPLNLAQKIIPVASAERDQITLPSVQGMQQHANYTDCVQKTFPGIQVDRDHLGSALPSVQGFHHFHNNADLNARGPPPTAEDRDQPTLPSVQGMRQFGTGGVSGQKRNQGPGDREHSGLPPVQGFNTQGAPQENGHMVRSVGMSNMVDSRSLQWRGSNKTQDDSLSNDVLAHRSMTTQGFDVRQGGRHYRNVHGLRQLPIGHPEQSRLYQGANDASFAGGAMYKQSPDFFPLHQTGRTEEHDAILRGDMDH